METKKTQLRKSAEACKKAERKYVTVWKALTAVTLVLALAVSACSVAMCMKENDAESAGNGAWQVIGKDPNAVYYSQDYSSEEERLQAGKELAYQVAAEGSVLLTNNGALPLADGAKVSFSAAPEGLQAALESNGLTVGAGDADALIVTVTRAAKAESPEPSYLQLNEAEKTMLADAARQKADGKVKSVILLLQTAYPMQMDFMKDNDTIDASLWIGDIGAAGMGAVADILAGLMSPSGRLTDTYCYDIFSAPAMKNAEPAAYSGAEGENGTHLIYQEGVYVGYKYYETRYEDYVMVTNKTGEYQYHDVVAFPFGHGLSYTTFLCSDLAAGYNSATDQYEMYVLVTNTGEVAGKETVQVYAQTPYTEYDKKYGVEKPAVSLVAFMKTKLLQPGETEELVLRIDRRNLASFDTYGKGTYIVEQGKYYLTLARDAHDAVNNILARKGYDTNEERKDAPGDLLQVHYWDEEKTGGQSYSFAADGLPIMSQLSDADPNLYEGTRAESVREKVVTWLSRNDWEGTFPTDAPQALTMSQPSGTDAEAAEMPLLGADNGIKLQQLRNKSYDDPLWNSFLNQLTFADMSELMAQSTYQNAPQKNVQTTAFPGETVMAATFNRELCYSAALLMGNDCLAAETTWIEGPSVGIRRTPFVSGSCSEDSYLVGEIGTAQIYGFQEKGINASLRNFGLCEPGQTAVWLSEQTARELYLRSCRLVVEKVNANNVAVTGTRWGAGTVAFITNILRSEWEHNGALIAEAGIPTADGLVAGVTAFAATGEELASALQPYANDPAVVSAMREACHRNLYALVNSAAMNGIGTDTVIQRKGEQQEAPKLDPVYILVPALFWLLPVAAFVLWQRGKKLWVNTEVYKNYITLLENQKK